MIIINSPMKQEFIIETLSSLDGEIKFELVKKEGVKIYFNVNIDDINQAIDFAKKTIKATEIGKVLYFSIHGE